MHLNYNSSHHRNNLHHRNANDKEMLYGLIHHTTKTSKPTSDVRSSALLKDLFPAGHKLRKIFNRNTIKLSYSCMTNVKQIIDGHSKAILKMAETAQLQKDGGKTCSCRKKEDCPMNGECLVSEVVWVVYQATVTIRDKKETYTGLKATQFKARYRNHLMSFRHEKRRNETELSKHLFSLRDHNVDPNASLL